MKKGNEVGGNTKEITSAIIIMISRIWDSEKNNKRDPGSDTPPQ